MATRPDDAHAVPPNTRASPAVVADPAQEALVRALRASFNVLRVLMIVLVVLYLSSGIFPVEVGKQGLVARLGKLRENAEGNYVFKPDWYWALPDPFDKKFTITGQIQSLRILTFVFNHPDAATKELSQIVAQSRDLQPGVDGAMFTGDKNLSHGRWEVQYKIGDAAQFVQNIGATPDEFEPLLRRLLETAVVREVAGRTVEEVTREAPDAVQQGVQDRLQRALDVLQTGVTVVQVMAQTIEPGAVRDAFIDVSRAESERLSMERQAEQRATEVLNRAAGDRYAGLLDMIREYGAAQMRGEDRTKLGELLASIDAQLTEAEAREAGQVAVKLRDARSAATTINGNLRSQYDEFVNYVEQRAARPQITVLDLWVQMRQEILGNRENEVFFVPDSNEIEILVNRDVQRQRELEDERNLQRQMRERMGQ